MNDETYRRGQHFRIRPGAVWGFSPVATNFNIGDVIALTRDDVDGDGDLYGVNQHGIYGYVNARYAVPVDFEVVDAPVAPQTPVTALEAARAEVARLEALVAADDAVVTERALAMREVWLAASYGHNVIDLWKAVARAFPA